MHRTALTRSFCLRSPPDSAFARSNAWSKMWTAFSACPSNKGLVKEVHELQKASGHPCLLIAWSTFLHCKIPFHGQLINSHVSEFFMSPPVESAKWQLQLCVTEGPSSCHLLSFFIWTVCGKFPVKRGDTRLHQLDFNGLHVCRESVLPKETSLHGFCFGFNLAHWQQAGQREIFTRVLVWAHVCSVAYLSCCVKPDTMTWGQGIGRMLSHASKATRGEICPCAQMLVLRAASASVLVQNQVSVNAGQLCL